MKFILKEYIAFSPFNIIISTLLTVLIFGTPINWGHAAGVIVAAYGWFTLFIIARTIRLTYARRKARRNNP